MPADPLNRPAPRARPVADAPLPAGAERMQDLARRWALELLGERPLTDAASLPLKELAARAPGLCEQVLRALGSERDLDRLLGLAVAGEGGARGGRAHDFGADLIACAGVSDAEGALRAVESLRGALWQDIQEGLPASEARLAGPLGDRLAYLCSALLGEALVALAGAPQPASAPGPATPGARPSERGSAMPAGRRIVILDEYVDAEPAAPFAPAASGPPERAEQIEIHDRRREEGPAAWIGSIGAQLERFAQDGRPFAVLLVEMAGAGGELPVRVEQLEATLAAELEASEPAAPAATLTSERPGRCWIVVPGTDRGGAEALAGRLEAAPVGLARRLGATVEVSVGIAVCPEDGRSASALAAHADVGLYASRWEARSSVRGESA